MRKDIKINTQTGELEFIDSLDAIPNFEMRVFEDDLNNEVIGQILIPEYFNNSNLYEDGIRVSIPYIPQYKTLKIKIFNRLGAHSFRPIYNPATHEPLFYAYAEINGRDQLLKASQLPIISDSDFFIKLENTNDERGYVAKIYEYGKRDFKINNANIQNRNLMLKCMPTNSYRYPTVGVGLLRFINSNVRQSNLAQVIQSQFEADRVKVINANFNPKTGDLDLELDFSEADEDL